jgi:hypothetical protein
MGQLRFVGREKESICSFFAFFSIFPWLWMKIIFLVTDNMERSIVCGSCGSAFRTRISPSSFLCCNNARRHLERTWLIRSDWLRLRLNFILKNVTNSDPECLIILKRKESSTSESEELDICKSTFLFYFFDSKTLFWGFVFFHYYLLTPSLSHSLAHSLRGSLTYSSQQKTCHLTQVRQLTKNSAS